MWNMTFETNLKKKEFKRKKNPLTQMYIFLTNRGGSL